VRIERRVGGEARDGLHPGGDVLVALAGRDRVERHPQGLQRGGAEAVDGHGRHVVVDAGQQLRVAADVVALLAHREPAAHQDVVRLREVDLGVAVHERRERHGGEIVGAHVLERSLGRAPDRGADRVHDDGVGHGSVSLFGHGRRRLRRRAGAMRRTCAAQLSDRPPSAAWAATRSAKPLKSRA
jgi:hypothetical protein